MRLAVSSCVPLGLFWLLVAPQRQHATSLRNLTVAFAARHCTLGYSLVRGHGSHGERVGVVPEIKKRTAVQSFEAEDADSAS
jgi:hypothetical protein